MAVVGIGIDLADVADMARRLESGDILRAFSERERAYADGRPKQRAQIYAGNWAAKEAFAKAIGTGVPLGSVGKLVEIEVLREESGKPYYEIGPAFAPQIPEGARLMLSISHTANTAGAVAIVESP